MLVRIARTAMVESPLRQPRSCHKRQRAHDGRMAIDPTIAGHNVPAAQPNSKAACANTLHQRMLSFRVADLVRLACLRNVSSANPMS